MSSAKKDSIFECIRKYSNMAPNDIAVVDGDGEITYEQLKKRTYFMMDYLKKQGVNSGDSVLVLCERNAQLVVCLLALFELGAVYVFFASTFWRKLKNIFGECCISKLEKVAKPGRQLPCQPHGHCRQYLIVTA